MPEIQPEGQAKAEGTHRDAYLQNILTKDHFPFLVTSSSVCREEEKHPSQQGFCLNFSHCTAEVSGDRVLMWFQTPFFQTTAVP